MNGANLARLQLHETNAALSMDGVWLRSPEAFKQDQILGIPLRQLTKL